MKDGWAVWTRDGQKLLNRNLDRRKERRRNLRFHLKACVDHVYLGQVVDFTRQEEVGESELADQIKYSLFAQLRCPMFHPWLYLLDAL